jgi:all-trans-retinol 13,14-reductase
MTPPDENQGEYAERMLINCIMDFEPVKRWEETRVGHRGKEYELWKQELTDRILERMEDLRPGFKQCVESVYAASPLTIRDFYHTKEGAIFGYRKDCENILLSQVPIYTKISNLLLTGQNINLHGICGVPLTAINTAEALLGRNAVINKINECYV